MYVCGSVCVWQCVYVCSHMFCMVCFIPVYSHCVRMYPYTTMYICTYMYVPKYLYVYCNERFGDMHPIHMCIPVPSPIAKDGQKVLSLKDQDSKQCSGECYYHNPGCTWG